MGSGTLTVGGNGSTTFSGVISGSGLLTKTGTGTLATSGNNTFSGDLVVDGGTYNLPSGSIAPLEQTTIYPRANGYVRKWLVDLGDRVKEGQSLVEIDDGLPPEPGCGLARCQRDLALGAGTAHENGYGFGG